MIQEKEKSLKIASIYELEQGIFIVLPTAKYQNWKIWENLAQASAYPTSRQKTKRGGRNFTLQIGPFQKPEEALDAYQNINRQIHGQ